MKRIAIVGSRRLSEWQIRAIQEALDGIEKSTIVVSGDCAGVDLRAIHEASERGLMTVMCLANWRRYGPAAGPMRNYVIVDLADECIALPDEKSKGTWDTVNKFRAAGKPVRVLREGGP